MRKIAGYIAVALLCACASADSKQPPKPSKEVVSGGARIRGGGIRMDVEVGRAVPAKPAKAQGKAIGPNGVVTP